MERLTAAMIGAAAAVLYAYARLNGNTHGETLRLNGYLKHIVVGAIIGHFVLV